MRWLALIALVACASPPKGLQFLGTWPARAPEYQGAYDRWTRHERAWKDWTQQIDGFATLKSSEFRAAFAAERAREERMSDEEATKIVAAEQAELGTGWQIELVVQTANEDWNDFARPNSIWRVALVADGVATASTKIIEDPRPKGALQIWFPGMDTWHHAYVASFPPAAIPSGAQKVSLEVSGARGKITFHWN
jgi:hypothetical protein